MVNLKTLHEKVNWTSITLNIPVVFRQNDSQYSIRYMRNVRGKVMCELAMDDDKIMRDINELPPVVQQMIDNHLKLQEKAKA